VALDFEDNENKELVELQDDINNNRTRRQEERQQLVIVEDGGKAVGWLERMVRMVHDYGLKEIFLALFVIAAFLGMLMFANAMNNQKVIENWLAKTESESQIGADIRKTVNPKITKSMLKLMYKTDADRVCIFEMHNGKDNPTSLPFIYCDMTYEEAKDDIGYISDEYENLNMSKYNFPSYIYENRYFVGTTNDLNQIDKKIARRFEDDGVKYLAAIIIHSKVDIGFLMLLYNSVPSDTDEILKQTSYYVQEISLYLDYKSQTKTD
jgi:hypothetical protein